MVARMRSRISSSSEPFPDPPLLLSISMASSSGTRLQAGSSCGSTRRILTLFRFFHHLHDTTSAEQSGVNESSLSFQSSGPMICALIGAVGSGEEQRNQNQNGAGVSEWKYPSRGPVDALGHVNSLLAHHYVDRNRLYHCQENEDKTGQ